jgi:GNAT superfamily N-acetyltransferase
MPVRAECELRVARLDSIEAVDLLAGADAYNSRLYGHRDQSPIDAAEFTPDQGGTFLVAFSQGVPVACGGLRRAEPPAPANSAEIKRIFVDEHARGQGLARSLLAGLEDSARIFGYSAVVLDVGGKQHAAHGLYESCGYRRIPGFTIYRGKPGNRAYAKNL